MADGLWRVKAYIEYEIEASCEEEAMLRMGDCIMRDLDEDADIRNIAEVAAEKISDEGLEE